MFKFQYQNEKKQKSGKIFLCYIMRQQGDYTSWQVLGITDQGNRKYKQGQLQRFQIGVKRLQIGDGISNWGKGISNQGRDYKQGQERFQIGTGVRNRCRTYLRGYSKTWVKGYNFYEQSRERPRKVKQERSWAKSNNITNNYVPSMELNCSCSEIS